MPRRSWQAAAASYDSTSSRDEDPGNRPARWRDARRDPTGIPAGREGLRAIASALRKGFPDMKIRIDLEVAEGDLVASYSTVSGTHKGELFGMPATGKHAEWAEIHIVKIVNGKITEHWGIVDQMGMLRQLGLAPTPQTAPAAR